MAGEIRPAWCRCKGPKFGPYQAPPGHVTCFVFGTPSEIAAMEADDERARVIKNEYIDACDAIYDASDRRRSAKFARAYVRFTAARDALYALQAECDHPVRYRGCCVRCARMDDERSPSSYLHVVAGRLVA